MALFEHIKYFLYLAWHWNIYLAFFVSRHEWKGEKKYGISTIGIDDLRRSLSLAELMHASIYQPVNYYTADQLMAQLTPDDLTGSFVDAGCGRGRVLAIAAYHGFKQISGFDISQSLCNDAMETSVKICRKHPSTSISIDCINAEYYSIPDDTSVIFLFNPFDKFVMEPFAKNVMKSLQQHPRNLKVLYANPVCKDIWLDLGFSETHRFKKLHYLEGSVLAYSAK